MLRHQLRLWAGLSCPKNPAPAHQWRDSHVQDNVFLQTSPERKPDCAGATVAPSSALGHACTPEGQRSTPEFSLPDVRRHIAALPNLCPSPLGTGSGAALRTQRFAGAHTQLSAHPTAQKTALKHINPYFPGIPRLLLHERGVGVQAGRDPRAHGGRRRRCELSRSLASTAGTISKRILLAEGQKGFNHLLTSSR